MDSGHLRDKKIKLIFNEFGPVGYWVWSCLIDTAYEENGYYISVEDKDWVTLFASDVCKVQVSLVDEVIKGCVRRGLFDKTVFDMFEVLTSERMQKNYLDATNRQKEREIIKEYWRIPVEGVTNLKSVSILKENVYISEKNVNTFEQNKLNKIKLNEIKSDRPVQWSDVESLKTHGSVILRLPDDEINRFFEFYESMEFKGSDNILITHPKKAMYYWKLKYLEKKHKAKTNGTPTTAAGATAKLGKIDYSEDL